MINLTKRHLGIPVIASAALVLAACGGGGGGGGDTSAAQAPDQGASAQQGGSSSGSGAAAGSTDSSKGGAAAGSTDTAKGAAPAAKGAAPAAKAPAAASNSAPAASSSTPADSGAAAATSKSSGSSAAAPSAAAPSSSSSSAASSGSATTKDTSAPAQKGTGAALTKVKSTESSSEKTANNKIAQQKNGATDMGITKTDIKLGSVNMHGMALGNVLVQPQVRGNQAAAMAINDRGGVLGRRISIVDCDDGPGEVSRAKACIKKLVGQDKIFGLITGVDWATASIHDDLKANKMPYIGAWAYSQTEWQDPFMFPTHMSMIHEAMSGANWVKDTVKPKTYGLVCLTSPEMQIACDAVKKILDGAGEKMVKKVDVGISETSMSAQILAMRSANPDHIVHYVINPATMAKFMVEAAQQDYYPPMGISGNHLAAEVLGSLFGKHPVGRYWTNTTYKLWGPEFMATMTKYAKGNKGTNHHIVQAGYVAVNMFAQAAKEVGPNLTRDRLMTTLGNGTVWKADASLDQKFQYTPAERAPGDGQGWNPDNGQGREFMYKYTGTNTVGNPTGTPEGFAPDPKQFVLHTK